MFNIVVLQQVHSPRKVPLTEKREDHWCVPLRSSMPKKGLFLFCCFCAAIQLHPRSKSPNSPSLVRLGHSRLLSFPLPFLPWVLHFWAQFAAELLPACPCPSGCPAAVPLCPSLGKRFKISSGCRTVPSLRTDQRSPLRYHTHRHTPRSFELFALSLLSPTAGQAPNRARETAVLPPPAATASPPACPPLPARCPQAPRLLPQAPAPLPARMRRRVRQPRGKRVAAGSGSDQPLIPWPWQPSALPPRPSPSSHRPRSPAAASPACLPLGLGACP